MGCLIGVLAEQGQYVLWHYEKNNTCAKKKQFKDNNGV